MECTPFGLMLLFDLLYCSLKLRCDFIKLLDCRVIIFDSFTIFRKRMLLRVLDSLQLTAKHRVSTPVNWKQGEDVIIVPAVSDEEAKEQFPDGWNAVKPYLRIVPQPQD